MDAEQINVLYCCDENYAQHMCVCITSMLLNNPAPYFKIVCVVRDLKATTREKIEDTMRGFPRAQLTFADPVLPDGLVFPVGLHYTLDTYQRLWVRKHFPRESRVMYLDPDMVIVGDITPVWKADVQDKVLAAVPIPNSESVEWFHMPRGSQYFSAGVMLLNLDAWDRESCPDILIDFMNRNAPFLRDVDQDVLNLCLLDRWVPLPVRYNVISPYFKDPNLLQYSADPCVVHFNGPHKPWKLDCDHPRKALYLEYLNKTAFRGARFQDDNLKTRLRLLVAPLLPKPVKAFLRRFRNAAPDSPAVRPPGPLHILTSTQPSG